MQALTTKTVNFEGEFFRYKDVPFELEPFSRPHPPLWYGVVNPDSAERAAKAGMNFISNSTAAIVKAKVARYTAAFQPVAGTTKPKFGMTRYMVLADSEDKALEIGRRGLSPLVEELHVALAQAQHRAEQRQLSAGDRRPDRGRPRHRDDAPPRRWIFCAARWAESGANYLVCRFAFGDLSLSESTRSLELFQRHVMPALRESVLVAAE